MAEGIVEGTPVSDEALEEEREREREEEKRQEEEERRKKEEEEERRRKEEEETRRREEEERQKKLEEELKQKLEEEKKRAEEETKAREEAERTQEELQKQQFEEMKKVLPEEDTKKLEDPFERVADVLDKEKQVEEAVKKAEEVRKKDPFERVKAELEEEEKPLVDKKVNKAIKQAQEDHEEYLEKQKKDPEEVEKDRKKAEQEAKDAGIPEEVAKQVEPMDASGVGAALMEGISESATGVVAKSIFGVMKDVPKKERSGFEYAAKVAGEIAGDIPAFALGSYIGGIGGAAIGSLIGSAIPGAGTAAGAGIGGVVGAGVGAMALPVLVKESYREYEDYVQNGGEASFGNFLKAAGRVAQQTGRAGAVGGIFGMLAPQVSKLIPMMNKMPGMNKILATRPGRFVASVGAETVALTGAETIVDRELPSADKVLENAAIITGMKIGHSIAGKAKEYVKRPLVETTEAKAARKKVFKERMDVAKKILPEGITDFIEKTVKSKEKTARYEEVLKDYLGAKNEKLVESTFKWREEQAKAEQKGKFTPEQLKDMTEYVAGIDELPRDIPENAKKFVKEVVKPHLDESLKTYNAYPETENVATYEDAFKKLGLSSKGKNVIDLMKQFDQANIKMMAKKELVNMFDKFQKTTGEDIIVNDKNMSEYKKAKKAGYIPFEDRFLRTYEKNGRYKVSTRPALVEPEFAKVFPGVFSKEAYKPASKFWKFTDQLRHEMNFARVIGSLFHGVAETESILGQRGLRGLRLKNMAQQGRELRSNKQFMMDAARHGLQVTKRIEHQSLKKGGTYIDRALDYIGQKEPTKAVKAMKRASTYLFDEFIPNAKAVSYNETVQREMAKFKKAKGRSPSPQETKAMKRIVAEHMNNIYGGQNWEQSKYFRDPKIRKQLRRIFAFSDWTVSALKQATSVLKPGLHGKIARRYLAKYILATGTTAAILRAVMGGLEQTDEKNQSIKGIRWNRDKALKSLENVSDLKGLFSFVLPDLPIRYGPKEDQILNMGRDEKGNRWEGHFGKQLLEVFGWAKAPVSVFFSKANPVFTTAFKQAFGVAPSRYGPFIERRGWYRGRQKPWKGKKGIEELKERVSAIAEEFIPFGLRGGAKKWLATFGGAFPVAKQYSPFKAEDDIENALLTKNPKVRDEKLAAIKALLKNNNYDGKVINRRISSVRNQLVREGKIERSPRKKRQSSKRLR